MSSNCTKCSQNEYQDKAGEQSCKLCPKNTFSRIGGKTCNQLPNCTKDDFYLLPASIRTCQKQGDTWMRKQTIGLPKVPGT